MDDELVLFHGVEDIDFLSVFGNDVSRVSDLASFLGVEGSVIEYSAPLPAPVGRYPRRSLLPYVACATYPHRGAL